MTDLPMNDDRMLQRLKDLDTPIEPSPRFADQLFGTLVQERRTVGSRRLGFERPQLLQMAAASLGVLLIVAIGLAYVANPRGPAGSPIVVVTPSPTASPQPSATLQPSAPTEPSAPPPIATPFPESTPDFVEPTPTPRLPATGPWQYGAEPPMSIASFLHSNDGLVWAFGFAEEPAPYTPDVIDLMSYDPATDQWTDHGRITYETEGLQPIHYSGVIGPDGDVYLFRGGEGGSASPMVWRIDFETLTADGPGPEAVYDYATPIVAPDGTIYVAVTSGADTPDWEAQRIWTYDPVADSWNALPALPEDRIASVLVADADSDLLVIGGTTVPVFTQPDTAEASPLNTSFRYDAETDSWNEGPTAPPGVGTDHAQTNPATLGSDGAIYVFRRNLDAPLLSRLDPAAGEWSQLPTPSFISELFLLSHLDGSADGQLVMMGQPDLAVVAGITDLLEP